MLIYTYLPITHSVCCLVRNKALQDTLADPTFKGTALVVCHNSIIHFFQQQTFERKESILGLFTGVEAIWKLERFFFPKHIIEQEFGLPVYSHQNHVQLAKERIIL